MHESNRGAAPALGGVARTGVPRRKPRHLTWRALVAGALVTSCSVVLSPAVAHGEPVPVEVARPEKAEALGTLRLTGTVTARQRAGLSSRTSGLVRAVHVDAGDRVAAGDLLLELDDALAALELQRAEAELQEGRARLAESRRLRSEAAQLVAERHLPATELHARAADVDLAAAALARLEADVRASAERLDRHRLVAPFAGVISHKHTESGEWVETGTAVLDLVDTDHLRLDVQVPQERFAEITAETPVAVEAHGSPGSAISARVAAKVPVGDMAARTFLVRADFRDPTGNVIPGMSARAAFAIGGAPHALSVPRDALVRSANGSQIIWTVDRSRGEPRALARQVELGRSLATNVEVLAGLDAGVDVIVRGNEGLRDGLKLDIRAGLPGPR